MQVHPKGEPTFRTLKKPGIEEDKMAKLLRERSTAQKRRQCKREELTTLGGVVHDLELHLTKLHTQVEGLSPVLKAQVLAAQARAGVPPLGCRLCCILERTDDYTSIDRLLQHLRMHHATDIRNRRDDLELIRFATDIPAEDAEGSDNDSDSEEETPESNSTGSPDPAGEASAIDLKRKLRLKRNAASARKSRKRKRVQLERWRMMLPMLRFQVATLENALASVSFPRPIVPSYDAEPDVISAAFALIGCSLSAPKTMS